MRKKPLRPSNEISQSYNDGTVEIYAVSNAAPPGLQPKPVLSNDPKYILHYAEQTLGINRIYLSRQAKAEILRVLRVPRVNISVQDVAITHDGQVYEISTVQLAKDVYPPSVDISLKRLTHKLEVLPK